jgi:hypothetical protein
MKRWYMNDKLERILKKPLFPNFKRLSQHLREGTKKTTNNLSPISWFLGRDLDLDLPNTK